MPVVVHTADRLKIRSISLERAGALASLDRVKNRVVVYGLSGLLPLRRERSRLSEITEVQVSKRARNDGKSAYGIVLRRKLGDDIAFGCRSREDAMHLMRTISGFLKLE